MKRIISISVIIIVLFTSLIYSGCQNDSKKGESTTIGVILPLSGELASYGQPMKVGIDMAYEELKQKDKINIELKYIDSKAENNTAVSGIQQLININGVKYVIGDVSSSTTLAMIPVAEKNHVFLLSPGASSPKLRNVSKFFARNYPSSIEESIESAKFVFDTLKFDEAAVIYVNNEYGLGLKEMFEKKYSELGGKIIFSEGYEFEQTDFHTLITKIRNVKPKLIYLAGNQKEMGRFMKQYHEAGINAQIVSDISFLEPDCLNVAGESAEGVIVPVAYYNPKDSLMQGAFNFGNMYRAKFNKEPSVAVAVGYDALILMTKAIIKGEGDPQLAANYIRNLKNYDGALGHLNFTDGDVSIPVVFKTIREGEVVNYTK